jgi:hypothetical protein
MLDPGHIPEPWASFLSELDGMATEPVNFHCIGGFVVTRKYGFKRETNDLDVLSVTPRFQLQEFLNKGRQGSELHHRYRVYLDVVGVIDVYPDAYEDRLTELYPGQLQHIRLLAAEAHDLALMKLGRNNERDREDVKFLARQGFITPEELNRRYTEEMRSYIAEAEQRYDPVMNLWVEMIREVLADKAPSK